MVLVNGLLSIKYMADRSLSAQQQDQLIQSLCQTLTYCWRSHISFQLTDALSAHVISQTLAMILSHSARPHSS